LWWSTHPRKVLQVAQFRLHRSLHKSILALMRAYFGECDRSFRRVVSGGLSGVFSAVSVT